MHISDLSALALLSVPIVTAFANSSPFLFLSTSSVEISHGISSLSSSSTVQESVEQALRSCPSHYYVLVSQPGASSSDFSPAATVKKTMPGMSRMWADTGTYDSRYSVNDVVGLISPESWTDTLVSKCKTKITVIDKPSSQNLPNIKSEKQIIQINFPKLSQKPERRCQQLSEHDSYLEALASQLESKGYTMLYYTTPPDVTQSQRPKEEMEDYEMDESPLVGVLHSDLKRDVGQLRKRQENNGNQTIVEGPLFAKYQFLSPGIFMGGLVSLLLLFMLYIGFYALSSLQVTYAAFDKEQGPPGSKKAQ